MLLRPALLLLGDPVSQSKSPAFQNAGLRAIGSAWEYGVLRVDAAGCEAAIDEVRQGRRVGVNVTAPHKEVAARAVDTLSPLASRLGAVNCVRAVDGRAVGDNTDVAGIVASLRFMGAGGGEAVIFGAGGGRRV
jgi:shikimate dehydrogenase